MLEQITLISNFVINAFIHIWPYLVITIPISVAVNMSGASKHINKAFKARPVIAIILATVMGAFSPFCSCGVIPIIAALLMGGVPLAPVMAFWIASPSMDPEMFFLSAAMLGWDLAVWRMASTLLLSLSAGFITHYLWKTGWLGNSYINAGASTKTSTVFEFVKSKAVLLWQNILKTKENLAVETNTCCNTVSVTPANDGNNNCGCSSKSTLSDFTLGCCDEPVIKKNEPVLQNQSCGCGEEKNSFGKRLYKEIIKSTLMVAKFMLLAFFLEALIVLYVPQNLIIAGMGKGNILSVFWAALIGVPVYTSNLSALPMMGGLLQQGMNPGAALAFLISGPITTIPAMAAVRGLTTKKVFYLYVSFAFFGALIFGYLYYAVSLFK